MYRLDDDESEEEGESQCLSRDLKEPQELGM